MARVLVLTNASDGQVLDALSLLGHQIGVAPLEAAALIEAPPVDAIVIDARRELAAARSLSRLLRTTGAATALLGVVTEGGLTAVTSDWGLDDVVLHDAGPAEVEARLRLAIGRAAGAPAGSAPAEIRVGALAIEESTYTARLRGTPVDLTFKEFELLKFLAQHPGRVFTRTQLLQEVWGYDYFGGTRTVDVHVRRLRAKLGPEHEAMIGTVRNVGYKFVSPPVAALAPDGDAGGEEGAAGAGGAGGEDTADPGGAAADGAVGTAAGGAAGTAAGTASGTAAGGAAGGRAGARA